MGELVSVEDLRPARDEQFFALILSGASVKDAAAACGLSLNQGYRRLNAPAFRERLADGRQAVTSSLAFRIAELLGEVSSRAIGVLDSIMDDPQVAPSVRVAAARAALQTVLKIAELEEARSGLGARLEQLERELAPTGVHPSGAALRGGGS